MRILLVRLRQIGDVVFTTPAIHALRQRFPDAHLSYLVEPAAAPVVAGNPHLDEVIVAPRAPRRRAGWLGDLALGRRLRARTLRPRHRFSRRAARLAAHLAERRARTHRLRRLPAAAGCTPAESRGRGQLRPRHSVENQWDLLAPLGVAPPDRSAFPVEMPVDRGLAAARRRPPDARRRGRRRSPRSSCTSAPAIPFRRWPAAHFVELAVALAGADPRRRVHRHVGTVRAARPPAA